LAPFLPATTDSKPACVWFGIWTGEHHAPHMTSLPTPWKHKPVQPLGRPKPPNKTETHKQQTVI
jgi:hypothetical protein